MQLTGFELITCILQLATILLLLQPMKIRLQKNVLRLVTLSLILLAIAGSCRKPSGPPGPDTGTKYDACFEGGSSSSLDIVTFNVEQFPKEGYETIAELATLIKAMNADIIALQEITSTSDLDRLDVLLDDYRALEYPINNSDWNLAYLYNPSEIQIDASETKIIFDNDWYSFPRPPFEIHATHVPSSTDLILLNNHLKCCGGSDNENRRRTAAEQLHDYIDSNYPNDAVIVLGDLNDEIDGTSYSSNVFWDFVNDPSHYSVADMPIATGSSLWWSYPSWPSHIDHIIITDELFDMVDTLMTLKPDACYNDYPDVISDHRPVYLRLK